MKGQLASQVGYLPYFTFSSLVEAVQQLCGPVRGGSSLTFRVGGCLTLNPAQPLTLKIRESYFLCAALMQI